MAALTILVILVLLGRTVVAGFVLAHAVVVICEGGEVLASAKGRMASIKVSSIAESMVSSIKRVVKGATTKASFLFTKGQQHIIQAINISVMGVAVLQQVSCWVQGVKAGLRVGGKHGFTVIKKPVFMARHPGRGPGQARVIRTVMPIRKPVFMAIVIRTIFMPIRKPVFMARHPGRGPGQARVIRTIFMPIRKPVFMAIVIRTIFMPIRKPVFMACHPRRGPGQAVL